MTAHAEDALGCPRIAEILDLPLAIATSEACFAEGLVASQDGQVLDLISASIAAVRARVANERAISKQEEVRVGVERRATVVASEAIDVPSVARYVMLAHFPDARHSE